MYLVLSALTYSPISLAAATQASAFFLTAKFILVLLNTKSEIQEVKSACGHIKIYLQIYKLTDRKINITIIQIF